MPKAATEVRIEKYIKDGDKWKFVRVQYAKGRPKADPRQGDYYLVYGGRNKKRKCVGPNLSEAEAARQSLQNDLEAVALGKNVTPMVNGEPAEKPKARDLAEAIRVYLATKRDHQKPKTHAAYRKCLEYFQQSCKRTTLEEITKEDLLGYLTFLRSLKLADRSVFNYYERLCTFLKAHELEQVYKGIDKMLRPTYTEEVPKAYNEEELQKFFAKCDDEERVIFEFFLGTGCREQEVMYMTWNQIDLKSGIVTVAANKEHGYKPKAYKGRQIPISRDLVALLTEWKAKRTLTCPLVFPTKGCEPKLDFLDMCKRIAYEAELNCGNCITGERSKAKKSCAEGACCSEWFLHKFRATFATRCLNAGIQLPNLQMLMGHEDIESTMRYLQPSNLSEVRERIEIAFGPKAKKAHA